MTRDERLASIFRYRHPIELFVADPRQHWRDLGDPSNTDDPSSYSVPVLIATNGPGAKAKPPALMSGRRRLFYFYLVLLLCLDDAGCDVEDQLLVRGADRRVPEQVAQERNVAEHRYLRNRY